MAAQLAWDLLSGPQQNAALALGWMRETWDRDRSVPTAKGSAAEQSDTLIATIASRGQGADNAKRELRARFGAGTATKHGPNAKGGAPNPADAMIADAESGAQGALTADAEAQVIEAACVTAGQRVYSDTLWNISTIYMHLKEMNLLEQLVHAQLVWANPAIEPVNSADLKELAAMRDRVTTGTRKLESLIVLARTAEHLNARAARHIAKLGGTAAAYAGHLRSVAKASALIIGIASGAKVVAAGAAGVAATAGVGGKILAAAGLCTQATTTAATTTGLVSLGQALAESAVKAIIEPSEGPFSVAAVKAAMGRLEGALSAQAAAPTNSGPVQKKEDPRSEGTGLAAGSSASISITPGGMLKVETVAGKFWQLEPAITFQLSARVTDSGTISFSASLSGSLTLTLGGAERAAKVVGSAGVNRAYISDGRTFGGASQNAVSGLFVYLGQLAGSFGLPHGVSAWFTKVASAFHQTKDDGLAIHGRTADASIGGKLVRPGQRPGQTLAQSLAPRLRTKAGDKLDAKFGAKPDQSAAASGGLARHVRSVRRGVGPDAPESDSSEFNWTANASADLMTQAMLVTAKVGVTSQDIGGDLNWDNNGSYTDLTVGLDFQVGQLLQRMKHVDQQTLRAEITKIVASLEAQYAQSMSELKAKLNKQGWKGKSAAQKKKAIHRVLEGQRGALRKPLREAEKKLIALTDQLKTTEPGKLAGLTLSIGWQRYSTKPAGQSGYAVMFDRITASIDVPREKPDEVKKGENTTGDAAGNKTGANRSKRGGLKKTSGFEVTTVLYEQMGTWTINYVKQRFMRDRDGGVVVVDGRHVPRPHWAKFVAENKSSIQTMFDHIGDEAKKRKEAPAEKAANDDHWFFPAKFHEVLKASGFDARLAKMESLFLDELALRRDDPTTLAATRIHRALQGGYNATAENVLAGFRDGASRKRLLDVASGIGLPASTLKYIETTP